MYTDSTGYAWWNPFSWFDVYSNSEKCIIGGTLFAFAVILTAFTCGAVLPLFLTMGTSIISGGLMNGLITKASGGSFSDGFSAGALWGGIFAFGSSILRLARILKNGVVIGEGMKSNVEIAAHQIGAETYRGMPGYKIIKLFDESLANKLALSHNKAWLSRMIKMGVKITDIGIDVTRVSGRSVFYLMEFGIARHYAGTVFPYL